jgi:hypothetical protein
MEVNRDTLTKMFDYQLELGQVPVALVLKAKVKTRNNDMILNKLVD